MSPDLGKLLITLGVILIIVGAFFLFADRLPGLSRLGKLPGDIAVEKENFKFYFPITTSILISVILTIVFWIFSKFKS